MSSALPIARVSNQMQSALALITLQAQQKSMLEVQQQISTGKRLNAPSDDPAAVVGIMRLNQQVSANTQYSSNLSFAQGFLGVADSALGQVSSLVTQAQSLANSMVGSTASSDQRAAQAQIASSMLEQLMQLANTQYHGQSVFGGQIGPDAPFISSFGGYKYVGTNLGQGILTPSGSSIEYTVNGNQVFGGESGQVTGYQDLTPALTNSTRLVDLTGANLNGVTTGPINLTVGATTTSVDLSTAANVGDVLNILNAALTAAGSDATISTVNDSFVITGDSAQNISIADTATGTTASDLGLAASVAATASSTGTGLKPRITGNTTLASLRYGAGINSSGFIITNGTNAATITTAGLTTVQDLLNAINGSGTNVHASINDDANGINVVNPISGTSMTIGENGGTTADDLGIRSFSNSTTVASLNAGTGVHTASEQLPGPTGTIVVTKTDGTTFSLNVNGITTPTQLAAAINSASGNGTVTAALNASGNGLTLTDTSGGSGNLAVAAGSDFISNSSNLGIFGSGTGATLTGTDITFSTDDFRITKQDGSTFTVNVTGAATIAAIISRINSADGNNGDVTASFNPTGNGIRLTDTSVGGGRLTVSTLNSSPAATELGIFKTAPVATPGIITGDDVNPVQPQGLFTTLTLLRDALLSNDTAGIQHAAELLETDGQRVIAANGVVGAREQDVSTRQNNLTTEQTQLQESLSLLQDTDMTSAITRYQMLTTAYQAALQVTAKSQNLSLLDFLR